jgi:transcription factor C subunit 6
MDYDSHSQEYRLTDSFIPDAMTLGDAGERHTPKLIKKAETNPAFVSTALWSPYVGVHKAVWNNAGGIHNAGWLAVGTASGLGRVEWIEGRWYNNTVPAELAL